MALALTAEPRTPRVLADLAAGTRTRELALVVGGALLTALCAQITVPVPGSPVPITGQTFAVVVAGGALGARRGALSQLLYMFMGLLLPVYADGGSGTEVLFGASGGYIVGFVLAAWLVGLVAERGADRSYLRAPLAFALGQLAVFGIGVPWLKVAADMDWADAVHNGFTIFILGGVVKAVLAGVATPSAWRLLNR